MTIDQKILGNAHCAFAGELKFRTESDVKNDDGTYIAYCCVDGVKCPYVVHKKGHYFCDINHQMPYLNKNRGVSRTNSEGNN